MRTRKKNGKWQKLVRTSRLTVLRDLNDVNRYEVSWKKANGSYGRRRFSANSVEVAIESAPVVAGLEMDRPKPEDIRILDGLMQALEETRRGPRGRRDWLYQQTRFLNWLSSA